LASPTKAKTPKPKAAPRGLTTLLLIFAVVGGILAVRRAVSPPSAPAPVGEGGAPSAPAPGGAVLPEIETMAPVVSPATPRAVGEPQAQTRARDQGVAAYQREGARALDRSEVDRALEALEAAQKLDPANSKTFRLMERAYKLKEGQESKRRLTMFRGGGGVASNFSPVLPLSGAPEASPAKGPEAPEEPWEQEYTVQPEDVLQITVFEEPDLTTKVRVSRAGQIVFPMLGQVSVSGLTVSEVQERLTDLLGADYLVHPQVQVFVDKPRNVLVTGQVRRPGSYPLSTERATTVMELVALAGGFTEDADLNGTRIIRMKNGEKQTIRVRVTDIIRKGDKEKDEIVRADDILFVPESFF
jgi:polysaccharide export outer membrane protein